jgi:hypothetical protein
VFAGIESDARAAHTWCERRWRTVSSGGPIVVRQSSALSTSYSGTTSYGHTACAHCGGGSSPPSPLNGCAAARVVLVCSPALAAPAAAHPPIQPLGALHSPTAPQLQTSPARSAAHAPRECCCCNTARHIAAVCARMDPALVTQRALRVTQESSPPPPAGSNPHPTTSHCFAPTAYSGVWLASAPNHPPC